MTARPWRERRAAYLRERGRLADLIREGYVGSGFAVIAGGAGRAPSTRPTLIVADERQRTSMRHVDTLKLRQGYQQLKVLLDSIR